METARAEQIPLANQAVDGAVVMLALHLHHFNDLDQGIREISRITKSGKLVIFAFEQEKISNFWLTNYFPYFPRDTLTTFLPIEKRASLINQITQKETAIISFLLPANLSDLFAVSG